MGKNNTKIKPGKSSGTLENPEITAQSARKDFSVEEITNSKQSAISLYIKQKAVDIEMLHDYSFTHREDPEFNRSLDDYKNSVFAFSRGVKLLPMHSVSHPNAINRYSDDDADRLKGLSTTLSNAKYGIKPDSAGVLFTILPYGGIRRDIFPLIKKYRIDSRGNISSEIFEIPNESKGKVSFLSYPAVSASEVYEGTDVLEMKKDGFPKIKKGIDTIDSRHTLNKGDEDYYVDYDSLYVVKSIRKIEHAITRTPLSNVSNQYFELITHPEVVSSYIFDMAQLGTILRIFIDCFNGSLKYSKAFVRKTGFVAPEIRYLLSMNTKNRRILLNRLSNLKKLVDLLPVNDRVIKVWNDNKLGGFVNEEDGDLEGNFLINNFFNIGYFPFLEKSEHKQNYVSNVLGKTPIHMPHLTSGDVLLALPNTIPYIVGDSLTSSQRFSKDKNEYKVCYSHLTAPLVSLFCNDKNLMEFIMTLETYILDILPLVEYIKENNLLEGTIFSYKDVELVDVLNMESLQTSFPTWKGIEGKNFVDTAISYAHIPSISTSDYLGRVTTNQKQFYIPKDVRGYINNALIYANSILIPSRTEIEPTTATLTGEWGSRQAQSIITIPGKRDFMPIEYYTYSMAHSVFPMMKNNGYSPEKTLLPYQINGDNTPMIVANNLSALKTSYSDEYVYKSWLYNNNLCRIGGEIDLRKYVKSCNFDIDYYWLKDIYSMIDIAGVKTVIDFDIPEKY